MATAAIFCQGKPNLKMLNRLAKEIADCWYALGLELDVDEAELENIMHNNTQYPSPYEKAFAMLKKWHNQGTSSSYTQLAGALAMENRQSLVEKYCHNGRDGQCRSIDKEPSPQLVDKLDELVLQTPETAEPVFTAPSDHLEDSPWESPNEEPTPESSAVGANLDVYVRGYSATGINGANLQAPSVGEIMRTIAAGYVQAAPPENIRDYWNFLAYLERFRLVIEQARVSSLRITVKCTSLEILEDLWQAYTSGALNEAAERYLVTAQVLRHYNLKELKLVTFIEEDEYRRCKDELTELEASSVASFPPESAAALDEKCGDVNARDGFGRTSLHHAAIQGNAETITALIEKGSDVNARDGDGRTPLHLAAYCGRTENATALIEKGGDVNARDKSGVFPLHHAAIQGYTETVRALVEKGGDVNARDGNDMTPLHHAASQGNRETVTALVDNGGDVNARDGGGVTPLHEAAIRGNTATALALVEKGGDVNAQDGNDMTPLHHAASQGNTGIVTALVERGSDVNARDRHSKTPLHYADCQPNIETAKALVEKGRDAGSLDELRRTRRHGTSGSRAEGGDDSTWFEKSSDVRESPPGYSTIAYASSSGEVKIKTPQPRGRYVKLPEETESESYKSSKCCII